MSSTIDESGWLPFDNQKARTLPQRRTVYLHVLAGGLVILLSIFVDYILAEPPAWGPMQSVTLATGIGIVAIGFADPHGSIISRVSSNLCLSLLGVFLLLAAGEVFFRAVAFDFTGGEEAWRRIPLYYREPIVPTGDAFFRRPGPERWTGQVLNTRLKQLGILPNPYVDDRRGFRNPDHMSDWEIAVAGDSFTELGYLPYEHLFTSIMARLLNVRVLNLGASGSGPLAQLSYLTDYGTASSTKHAVIMFFEGNDLTDLACEYKAWVRWRDTGQRDFREFVKQSSLVKHLNKVARRAGHDLMHRSESNPVSAYFKSSQGPIPVTLKYAPPGRAQLSADTMDHLHYFFAKYAEYGEVHRLTAWLAYLPSKERVIHDHIEFSATATEELKNWRPTDLPEVIGGLCALYKINFIDLTPVLRSETSRHEQLLYNSIYDTHLNLHGSLIVR